MTISPACTPVARMVLTRGQLSTTLPAAACARSRLLHTRARLHVDDDEGERARSGGEVEAGRGRVKWPLRVRRHLVPAHRRPRHLPYYVVGNVERVFVIRNGQTTEADRGVDLQP